MPQIITHRGLDPDIENYFTESSFEAFKDQLNRGYGIEFDLNFSKDDKIFIFHDAGLERITKGGDKKLFSDMELSEITELRINACRLCTLDEILPMIRDNAKGTCALHLKSKFQDKKYLDILLGCLKQTYIPADKMIIFDVKLETAKYLKEQMPELVLAPSVAHPYDIKRFNKVVGKTLFSIDEATDNKKYFDWVWLDEWDRSDEKGKTKSLYNKKVFDIFRDNGLKISLVTPELHGTSPGLLGGEAHQDAIDENKLFNRVKEITGLVPDAICTDHPNKLKELI